MKPDEDYSQKFFSGNTASSGRSAEIIVPLIIDLLGPESVIDIGCGTGTWLSVFKSRGIQKILGVDGTWVKEEMLLIPKSSFLAHDLTQNLNIEKRFDLALSLEVGEHLEPKYARDLIKTLVRLSPAIVFSAAIPFQNGTHHVNEQWPDYWAALFAEYEYVPIDCLREKVWNNDQVAWWYAQNILLFAERGYVLENPKLARAAELTRTTQLSLVHPRKHLMTARNSGLKQVLQTLPGLTIAALKRRLGGARKS
jgi:SAM-dependent methyltransferase